MSFEALSQTVDSTVSSVKGAASTVVGVATLDADTLKNPVRAVMNVTGAISSVATLPMELLSTGLATLTNGISAVLPSLPAVQLGSMYVGIPHAHAHPPSCVPPVPPVPLPSLGAVMLGTCVHVLVGGMPAARCGDLGLAPTCGGLAPFFGIEFGSSKVFIGGTRAARMGMDFCTACTLDENAMTRTLAATMTAAAKGAAMSMAAGLIDAGESAMGGEGEMAAAQALGVAMTAAQAAADAVASAASSTMGTDPAIPPAMPGTVIMGAPNVLIAGLPLPNTPDPAKWLFNKIKGMLKKRKAGKGGGGAEAGGGGGCPG